MRKVAADAGVDLSIDSAGTAAYHIGKAPDPRSQQAALNRGIDMSGLKARKAISSDFQDFDYIFAMDQANYDHLQSIQSSGSKAKLELFLQQYGTMGRSEVPDPYYGGEEGFELVLDLLEDACEQFLKSVSK